VLSAACTRPGDNEVITGQGVDCAELKYLFPDSKDGIYIIDPDGRGPNRPIAVFCDMTTAGGGWTRIFLAATNNQVGLEDGMPFDVDSLRLKQLAEEALIGYVDEEDQLSHWAQFDFPGKWRAKSPMQYGSEKHTSDVTVDGAFVGEKNVFYGNCDFKAPCGNNWGTCAENLLSGRICIEGTSAPYWAFWASNEEEDDDACELSDMSGPAWWETRCTDTRRFAIYTRRAICGNGLVERGEECDGEVGSIEGSCTDTCKLIPHGIDCADIHETNPNWPDGVYVLDPDKSGPRRPFAAFCDMTTDGGGWTLVVVSADDGQNNWTWSNRKYWTTDTSTFGSPATLNKDYKSRAYREVLADEMMFWHEPSDIWAAYRVPELNAGKILPTIIDEKPMCYGGITPVGIPMYAGNLAISVPHLCSTELFLSPQQQDGTSACDVFVGCSLGDCGTIGPSWSSGTSGHGCPLDSPQDTGLGPNPVTPDAESFNTFTGTTSLGFGAVLQLNYGEAASGSNSIRFFVRRAVCGNGRKEAYEQCDDGGTKPGDGCDDSCLLEAPDGFELIPSGQFTMGCNEADDPSCEDHELPAREVELTRMFWLQSTEVTQLQWQSLLDSNPAYFSLQKSGSACGPNCPIESVNWFEALLYANERSAFEGLPLCYNLESCSGVSGTGCSGPTCTGTYTCTSAELVRSDLASVQDCLGYRLPTEAEWEYAARAGESWLYAAQGDITALAWTIESTSGDKVRRVGLKRANAFGLRDMSGNVSEWTWDWYGDYAAPEEGILTDPAVSGPTDGSDPRRVRRGGQFNLDATFARVSARLYYDPAIRESGLGFRLARTVPASLLVTQQEPVEAVGADATDSTDESGASDSADASAGAVDTTDGADSTDDAVDGAGGTTGGSDGADS
jgi:cysteine-rich repeat protein